MNKSHLCCFEQGFHIHLFSERKKTWKVFNTQHVCSHPASFDTEANDDPEDQNADVVWNDSQRDPCYYIHDVGDEETDPPTEPVEGEKTLTRLGLGEYINIKDLQSLCKCWFQEGGGLHKAMTSEIMTW